MLLILLRWFGPFISLEVEQGKLRWIARLTDPLINRIRSILPNMGPVDFGPITAILVVWLVRELSVGAAMN